MPIATPRKVTSVLTVTIGMLISVIMIPIVSVIVTLNVTSVQTVDGALSLIPKNKDM